MRGERAFLFSAFERRRPPPVMPTANNTIHFRQSKSSSRRGGSHVAALQRRCRYGDSQECPGAESRLAGGFQEKKKKQTNKLKNTDPTSTAF